MSLVESNRPTLGDIAAAAGVSMATVSRVLNRSARVSPELAERVHAAIEELNYHPNVVARSLRVDKSYTIGLLVPDIANSFFAEIAKVAERVFRDAGYITTLGDTDENPSVEEEYVRELSQRRVDGILMIPSRNALQHVNLLVQRGIPTVLVDRVLGTRTDSVTVDNHDGTIHAISHFVSRGYRRIAILAGPQDTFPGQERFQAYRQAISLHNLPLDESLIRFGDFSIRSGLELTLGLLDESSPPDAIFASNNLMGIGAIRALKQRRCRVPEDVALIHMDDTDVSELSDPPVTVVAQPIEEIAETAARLLLKRIHGQGSLDPQRIVLRPRLIIRQST